MKNVFFDFNGTVLDDADLCFDILNVMLKKHGLKEVDYEVYKKTFTFPIKDYYEKVGFDFNKVSFEELGKEFISYFQQRSLVDCTIFPDFFELVKELRTLGYGVYLCSASQYDNLIEQTNHFGITELFDDVIGIKDIYAKSKADTANNFIKDKGLDPKSITFIGDTLHDKDVAEYCGCDYILVSTGHQSLDILSGVSSKVEDSLLSCLKYFK